MNKKTVIIIVSAVVALAIAITATIAVLSSKLGNKSTEKDDNKSNISSGENLKEDSNTASTPSSNDSDIQNNVSSNDSPSNNDGDNSNDSAVSIPQAPNDITTFIVDNVTAEKGGKVKVPVYVSSNKGFMAVLGTFQYDTSVLKYTGYKRGNLFSEYDSHIKDGEAMFIINDIKNIAEDGVLVYLEFDVLATTAIKTSVKIVVDNNVVANKDAQYVNVETIDGSVTIK